MSAFFTAYLTGNAPYPSSQLDGYKADYDSVFAPQDCIRVLSLLIGVVSDATQLRWAFGGAILLMFGLGIIVCLAPLRTRRRDMAAQQSVVQARTIAN